MLDTVAVRHASKDNPQPKVYGTRWLMITLFAMLIISNATLFVSFAPISDISEHFFGDTYGNKSYLNLLATVFFICYFPGSLIGIYLMQHFHLRYTMIAAGAFTTIGACVRYIAIAQQSSLGDNTTYGLVLMGQCIAAISYPILVNVPALMSAVWFPVSERDLATMAGALFNPIGNAVGQVLPVIFVSETENDPSEGGYTVKGMSTLMLVEFGLALIAFVATVLLFQNSPPTPPSLSQHAKLNRKISVSSDVLHTTNNHMNNSNNHDSSHHHNGVKSPIDIEENSVGSDREVISDITFSSFSTVTPNILSKDAWREIARHIKKLFSNRNFVYLFICFTLFVSVANALVTLMNQFIGPHGYSNGDSSTFVSAVLLFGIIGAVIIGKIVERTRNYIVLLKGGFVVTLGLNIAFVCMLYKDNFWCIIVVLGLLGFCALPLLPLMLEACAETTYPIPEDISVGILHNGANFCGVAFVYVIQELLTIPNFGPAPFSAASVFLVTSATITAIVSQLYDGKNVRQALEKGDADQLKFNAIHTDFEPNVRTRGNNRDAQWKQSLIRNEFN